MLRCMLKKHDKETDFFLSLFRDEDFDTFPHL